MTALGRSGPVGIATPSVHEGVWLKSSRGRHLAHEHGNEAKSILFGTLTVPRTCRHGSLKKIQKRGPLHDSVRKRFKCDLPRIRQRLAHVVAGDVVSGGSPSLCRNEHTHAGPHDGRVPRLQPRTEGRTSMFTSKQYRDKAAEYKQLTDTAITLNEKREYQNLEQRFTTLA